MNTRNSLLALALVAQLLLAAGLYWGGQSSPDEQLPRALLEAATDQVDKVHVSDGEREVALVRDGDRWQLPALAGLPAETARVNEVLERVASSSTRWPVATTRASLERFEVAKDKFQRKVEFYQGDTLLGGFYLGTSPGFRQVHVRGLELEAVYAVELNVSDFPPGDSDWLDKSLLAASNLRRIEGADYAIVKNEDGGWGFSRAGVQAGDAPPELDSAIANRLAAALTGLRVQSVADDAPAPENLEPDAVTTLQVAGDDGTLQYRFFSVDDSYHVQRDDVSSVFSLSQYDYDRIAGVGLEQLARVDPQESSPSVPDGPAQEQAAVSQQQDPQG